MRVPMWVEKAGRLAWNGRDTRGHFDTVDRVSEARFKGEDAPVCRHACCKGRRAHPAGLPVMRSTTGSTWADERRAAKTRTRRPKPTGAARKRATSRTAGRDYAGYLHGQYLAADKATRGNMVNKAGRAKGYTGADFFRAGRRPSVERWGTDELRSWFGSGNAASSGRGQRLLTRAQWDTQQQRAA